MYQGRPESFNAIPKLVQTILNRILFTIAAQNYRYSHFIMEAWLLFDMCSYIREPVKNV